MHTASSHTDTSLPAPSKDLSPAVTIAILVLFNCLSLALSYGRERGGRMQEQSGIEEKETVREFTEE
jgi:hypothetical protein